MSEVLLQTIIEKLQALEIALLKERNGGKDDSMQQTILKEIKSIEQEITKLNSSLIVSAEKMSELLKE